MSLSPPKAASKPELVLLRVPGIVPFIPEPTLAPARVFDLVFLPNTPLPNPNPLLSNLAISNNLALVSFHVLFQSLSGLRLEGDEAWAWEWEWEWK